MLLSLFLALTLGSSSQAVENCTAAPTGNSANGIQYAALYGANPADWKQAICDELLQDFSEARFAILSSSRASSISPDQKGRLSFSALKAGRVKVVWDAGGNHKQTYWLKIFASKKVWVFKNRLKKYEMISARDVVMETIDVANMVGIKEFVEESPVGKIVTRQVRKNNVVIRELIQEPPLIARQDEITVSARTGALSIVTKGVALDHAWKAGDSLQVQVNGATEPVKAIVTGEKRVYVEI